MRVAGKDLQFSCSNQLKWTMVFSPQIHLSVQATLVRFVFLHEILEALKAQFG